MEQGSRASGYQGAARDAQQATRNRGRRGGRRRGKRATQARRLTHELDRARADRRAAWPEGGQAEFAAARQEKRLGELHADKRAMRREIVAEAPILAGPDVQTGDPARRIG